MNNVNRVAVCMFAVIMTAALPVKMVWSADENASVAQVYLEFDPATGQFVSVPATADNSPDGALGGMTNTHPASTQDPAAQTQNTTAPQTMPTTQTGTAVVDTGNPTAGGMSPMLIGSIIAIGLFGGIVLMMRKKSA